MDKCKSCEHYDVERSTDIIRIVDKSEIKSPRIEGRAHCLTCGHKWEAVAPIGTGWMECPSCLTQKGIFIFPVERDEPHWTCDCGNDLFRATTNGFYCPHCGSWQYGF